MEILGGEFEDSFFTEFRNRNAATTEEYTAKQCEPQWFSAEISSNDSVEIVTARKFNADFAYSQKSFQKALQEYSDCLSLLSSSNVAMRRDIQEGQARCLCYMGRHREALDIAQTLRNGSTNTDHLTTVLNLQLSIHQSAGNVRRVIPCLQQLITLYPFNPWHWKSLAEAYWDLLQAVQTSCSTTNYEVLADRAERGQDVEVQPCALQSDERAGPHSPKGQSSNDRSGPGTCVQNSSNICDKLKAELTLNTSSENKETQLLSGYPAPMEVKRTWMKSCASFIRTR